MESAYKYYEVEKVVNKKKIKRKTYYLIKWLCYPINECTWEPLSNLMNVKYMVDRFEKGYPNTIDEEIYNSFVNKKLVKEIKVKEKNLNKKRKRNKSKDNKVTRVENPKIEYIGKDKDYFDLLKNHLYIKTIKSKPKIQEENKNTNSRSNSIKPCQRS